MPTAYLSHLVHDRHRRSRRRLIPTELVVGVLAPDGSVLATSADLVAALALGPNESAAEAADDAPGAVLDHALRVDLLVRGLGVRARRVNQHAQARSGRGQRAAAFLIRSGPLQVTDADFAWWRAVRAACGIVGRPCAGLYVATRPGWLEVARATTVQVPRQRQRPTAHRQ